jgi:hypothetical protein
LLILTDFNRLYPTLTGFFCQTSFRWVIPVQDLYQFSKILLQSQGLFGRKPKRPYSKSTNIVGALRLAPAMLASLKMHEFLEMVLRQSCDSKLNVGLIRESTLRKIEVIRFPSSHALHGNAVPRGSASRELPT